eukprot:TRINITY_DN6996_c0_g1_i3.p1 TRINITY_DN6996_c0_g1~~TRINITY_DN6996_c0_g1_i3.p1  ORF type:complete len:522 (+),score=66.51 TRINITY_DN6996_c0_g1_i3:85-1650(+)
MADRLVSKETVLRIAESTIFASVVQSGGSQAAAATIFDAVSYAIGHLVTFDLQRNAPMHDDYHDAAQESFARFFAGPAKAALHMAEVACGQQAFSGLAVAAKHVIKLQWRCNTARNSAAKMLRDLGTAEAMDRHFTAMGCNAWLAKLQHLLGQAALPQDSRGNECTQIPTRIRAFDDFRANCSAAGADSCVHHAGVTRTANEDDQIKLDDCSSDGVQLNLHISVAAQAHHDVPSDDAVVLEEAAHTLHPETESTSSGAALAIDAPSRGGDFAALPPDISEATSSLAPCEPQCFFLGDVDHPSIGVQASIPPAPGIAIEVQTEHLPHTEAATQTSPCSHPIALPIGLGAAQAHGVIETNRARGWVNISDSDSQSTSNHLCEDLHSQPFGEQPEQASMVTASVAGSVASFEDCSTFGFEVQQNTCFYEVATKHCELKGSLTGSEHRHVALLARRGSDSEHATDHDATDPKALADARKLIEGRVSLKEVSLLEVAKGLQDHMFKSSPFSKVAMDLHQKLSDRFL